MKGARPLWQNLLVGDEKPLTCHECGAILTCLADMGAAGIDEQVLWDLAKQHLARCPDCQGYYQRQVEKLERLYRAESENA